MAEPSLPIQPASTPVIVVPTTLAAYGRPVRSRSPQRLIAVLHLANVAAKGPVDVYASDFADAIGVRDDLVREWLKDLAHEKVEFPDDAPPPLRSLSNEFIFETLRVSRPDPDKARSIISVELTEQWRLRFAVAIKEHEQLASAALMALENPDDVPAPKRGRPVKPAERVGIAIPSDEIRRYDTWMGLMLRLRISSAIAMNMTKKPMKILPADIPRWLPKPKPGSQPVRMSSFVRDYLARGLTEIDDYCRAFRVELPWELKETGGRHLRRIDLEVHPMTAVRYSRRVRNAA